MSDTQSNHFSDEDKYDNESFDTLVPESSIYGSEDELIDDDEKKSDTPEQTKVLPKKTDFWPGESSSDDDDDDVVVGQTIAEINTDPIEFDDDSLSHTPAARVFKLASATRDGMIANEIAACEGFDDDIEEDDDVILQYTGDRKEVLNETIKITARSEMLLTANEQIVVESSGIEIDEEFAVVYDNCDGGEVDVGEPNIYEELAEVDKRDEELFAEREKEDAGFLSDEIFETGYGDGEFCMQNNVDDNDDNDDDDDDINDNLNDDDFVNDDDFLNDEDNVNDDDNVNDEDNNNYDYDDDDDDDDDDEDDADTKTLGASSSIAQNVNEDVQSETKSLRTDDSMEEFKHKVMLSQRMRCVSDGAGDGAHVRSRKSSIPVWVGRRQLGKLGDSAKISQSEPGLSSMIPVSEVRKHGSQPDFSDADTLTPHEDDDNYDDENVNENENEDDDYMYEVCEEGYSEYNASVTTQNAAALCSYSMHLDMFTGPKETSTQRKKLKPNERRNKSFSNERLRDIERHNNILLHKILNQKPTYVLDEKKKKKGKFAALPPTTRVTSAEINRKKQQRQIDMDNQLLKRKLETISKRKPKAKK